MSCLYAGSGIIRVFRRCKRSGNRWFLRAKNVPTDEVWKDIPGYEGAYQVSTWGRVKTLARRVIRRNGEGYTVRERIRKSRNARDSRDYRVVDLGTNGRKRSFQVHRLVLQTFVGPCPPGMECCHWDGNPTNNHLRNLRWGTRKENVADMIRHGTAVPPPLHCGENNHKTKLTDRQVYWIRKLFADGTCAVKELSKRYGTSQHFIRSIVTGRSRKQAGGPILPYLGVARGSSHYEAKLTAEEVREIRRLWGSGQYLQTQLAKLYGVGPVTIHNIVHHKSWKHV